MTRETEFLAWFEPAVLAAHDARGERAVEGGADPDAACGLRLLGGEAVAVGMGSLEGTPGARHLQVVGKGDKTRAIPAEGALETVLQAYLVTRRARFPRHGLDHPATPLFVTSVAEDCWWIR